MRTLRTGVFETLHSLRRLLSGSYPTASPSRPRKRFRPEILLLEDRITPASHTVTLLTDTTANGSPGELRTEINKAAAGDTIIFQSGLSGAIKLTAGLGAIALSKNLTITGPGAGTITVTGQNAIEIFSVAAAATDTISGLTLSNGSATNGGAIANAGNLTLQNCVLTGNIASANGGGIENTGTLSVQSCSFSANTASTDGAGIDNTGTLTITGSTFTSNSDNNHGGAISNNNGMVTLTNSTLTGNTALRGAGVYSKGAAAKLTVQNSTIANNYASYYGGGIYSGSTTTTTLTNTTIVGNHTLNRFMGFGGGIAVGPTSQVTLVNTIVAGNTSSSSGSSLPDDIKGSNVVTGNSFNNLIGTGSAGGLVNGTNSNQVGVANPLLAVLGNYGGTTQTVALLPGSPAINTGKNVAGETTDQRGVSRPSGAFDIGAYESEGFTLTPNAGSTPQSTAPNTAFGNALALTVTANGIGGEVNGGIISYTVHPVSGASATLGAATATISSGQASVSATANGTLGSYTVTASATGVASQATFSLSNSSVTVTLIAIVVTPVNPSVAKGLTQQFKAVGTFSDTSTQDLTASVTWASATTSVATIVAGGQATAVGVGASTISAQSGVVTGTTTLNVTAATLQSIAVTPASPSVAKGLTQQFTAIGTLTDGTTQNLTASVTWNSGTTSVATISTGGKATAAGVGTSIISATSGSVVGSTTLTVSAPVLQSIAVTPASPSVAKGLTQQFTAIGTLTDGTTQNLTASVTWNSGTTSVATISTGGKATAAGVGTSTISATSGSVVGSTTLTVRARAVLQSIAVTPANPSVPKGQMQQFTATGTLTDGTTQNLTASVTWNSATTSVATISTGGLANAVTTGSSTISATSGAVVGSTVMTVTAAAVLPDPAHSLVTVGASSVAVNGSTTITLTAKDSSGNPITSGGATVTFALGGGTSNGTIGGVTDNGNGTYSATFIGTAVGTARTITAKINSVSVTTTPPTITVPANPLDVDGNGVQDALTDGILILRYDFGFTGTTLTSGALGAGATRTDPTAIKTFLDGFRGTMLNVDGNPVQADALTDGILLLRYLFGITGTTLTSGALGSSATRTTGAAVSTFLDSFNPSAGPLLVAIYTTANSPTLTAPTVVTFVFNRPVSDFAVGDIQITGNATVGSFTAVNGNTYTALVTPGAAGAVTVTLAAGVAHDLASNGNLLATFSITFQ